ncbi:hypothetical protein HK096_011506 [Nowakowskiella sp. JEL0078]|nr:hypothetical protein HK096_011506 [Nowakowskiella sp. JEL0078]
MGIPIETLNSCDINTNQRGPNIPLNHATSIVRLTDKVQTLSGEELRYLMQELFVNSDLICREAIIQSLWHSLDDLEKDLFDMPSPIDFIPISSSSNHNRNTPSSPTHETRSWQPRTTEEIIKILDLSAWYDPHVHTSFNWDEFDDESSNLISPFEWRQRQLRQHGISETRPVSRHGRYEDLTNDENRPRRRFWWPWDNVESIPINHELTSAGSMIEVRAVTELSPEITLFEDIPRLVDVNQGLEQTFISDYDFISPESLA